MIYALIKVPLYPLLSVWTGCVVHSVIENTVTGSKLHVVVSANANFNYEPVQVSWPSSQRNSLRGTDYIFKNRGCQNWNRSFNKVLKKTSKDVWCLRDSSNMEVWEMQAASGNYLSLSNSLWSDGLTTCFSLCVWVNTEPILRNAALTGSLRVIQRCCCS